MKTQTLNAWTRAAAFLTLLGAGAAQAGIVSNGGFENQTGSNANGYCYTFAAGCAFAGWTSTGNGTVVIGANSSAWAPPAVWATQAARWAALCSACKAMVPISRRP